MRRASRSLLGVVALAFAIVATVRAEVPGPILHEFIPPDPGEDVKFAATTPEGKLPAAIQTPSGLATVPDAYRPAGADHVYGGGTTDDGPNASYEPDRDTRRPNVETYDDPFSPATAPFKRLRAYDDVDANYALHVRDAAIRPLTVGGVVGSGDEPFYGDMSVDLLAGQPVRIPSVGPDARIVRMHVNPPTPVEVLHDGADNWFLRSTTRVRVRLVMELAIPRDTFGRLYADVGWNVLDGIGARRNGVWGHDAAVREVAQAIGVSRAMRPQEVVRRMIDYFRSFRPSDELPTGRQDVYLDLALSQKGVCRHRAFAFLVTALGLGIPSRMVVNEAHAWVEVYDSHLWHRVDLGGAAANLDHEPDLGRPPYVPLPDPYAWPSSHDSGQDLADRNRSVPTGRPSFGSGEDAGVPSDAVPAPGPTATTASEPDPHQNKLPETEVTVSGIDGEVRRGLPLHVQGRVSLVNGGTCAHLRVDVLLTAHPERRREGGMPSSRTTPSSTVMGSLSTDAQGHFDGAVVIPRDLPLGDYDLAVQTPGDVRCGPGRTR